jgi:hypothetical protein
MPTIEPLLTVSALPFAASVRMQWQRKARTNLTERGYLHIHNCFEKAFAEAAYTELKNDIRYSSHLDGKSEDFGFLRYWERDLSDSVEKCCGFLMNDTFLNLLASLTGARVTVTRKPTPFIMRLGDSIVAHDDCSDYPSNCLSAVLHFSKDWKRAFGGNTIVGAVKSVETERALDGSDHRRWVFSNRRSILTPVFNSLVLISLRPGMAHKVTRIRVDCLRLTIASTYGFEAVDSCHRQRLDPRL